MISKNLNPQQLEAVRKIDGPVMIIAGPGSGKTRVITERIAFLLKNGVDPKNILALTFTNKAANEMKQRVFKLTNSEQSFRLWMGTFHSVFAKILRIEGYRLNYSENFSIYDNDDSIKIIRRIIKDKNLDKDDYNPRFIHAKISILKNRLIDWKRYSTNDEFLENDKIRNQEEFLDIYKEYSEFCFKSNSMDFDDLLINTHKLFQNYTETCEKYQDIFRYIMIDEYQDTNLVQDSIVQQLSYKHKNICIVGDDSQSIYSFRGANINNILRFKSVFKETTEFKLEQNYRSTKNIVNVANTLIKNNFQKIDKTIFSNNETGDEVDIIEYYNDRDEGQKTAEIINSIKLSSNNLNQIAILYRNNSQSKSFEDALRKLGIGYKIFGGLSFYQRKEIKDIIAYLRLIINNNDEESLLRIINYPTRGIGSTTVQKLRDFAKKNDKTIWKALSCDLSNINISSGAKNKLSEFTNVLRKLFNMQNDNVFNIAQNLETEVGIIKRLSLDDSDENLNKLQNISELFNSLKLFSLKEYNNSLRDFINEISLDETKDENEISNKVNLMTIHQSKGLEFSYVFVTGLENGIFPSARSVKNKSGIEEERRLLYVAITRASKKIKISYCQNRFQFGTIQSTEKSLFLDELKDCTNFIYKNEYQEQRTEGNSYIQKRSFYRQKTSISVPSSLKKVKYTNYKDNRGLIKGMKINHNIFGKGLILSVDENHGNEKIKVIFDNFGKKILLTKFAKFEIIK